MGARIQQRGDRLVVNAASTGAALTFDDGHDAVWTPRILEALREANATATVFVIVPLALRYPRLIEATLEAGHGVEFHCYEHLRHTRTPREEIETDTREGLRALRTLGIGPRFWRVLVRDRLDRWYFERLYSEWSDPWGFETSEYERKKYERK